MGEVVKPMDKKKVLVKVHPEGKFVVDIDKNIDMSQVPDPITKSNSREHNIDKNMLRYS